MSTIPSNIANVCVGRKATTQPQILKTIGKALHDHVCIGLEYNDSWRLIEPKNLKVSQDGNLLLQARKPMEGGEVELRTYRLDRIQGARLTTLAVAAALPGLAGAVSALALSQAE